MLALSPAPRAAAAALPPIISQRFPAGRGRDYRGDSRCGPASMAMAARAFHRGRELSDAALIEHLDRLDDGIVNRATTPAGMVRMAASLKLHAVEHPGFDASWLRKKLLRGDVVIALGRPRYLPPTEAHTGGHYVAIVGVSPKGNFIINDPYRATSRHGQRYRVGEATLASFILHKPNGRLIDVSAPPRRSARRL
jgi:hypothetical protein